MTAPIAAQPEVEEGTDAKLRGTIRFALYAEVNMNLIDGSSVWVQSVSQTLTEIPGVEVTLLLRAPEQRDVLTAPLHANPRIELVHPESFGSDEPLDAEAALDALEELDGERSFDHVFCAAPRSARRPPRRQAPSQGRTLVLLPDAARASGRVRRSISCG